MPTLAQRFEQYHAENPAVFEALVALGREWIETTGRHKISSKNLVERARWELALQTSDSEFLINNSFTPFYARLLEFEHPELFDGAFELRHSEADAWMLGKIAEYERSS